MSRTYGLVWAEQSTQKIYTTLESYTGRFGQHMPSRDDILYRQHKMIGDIVRNHEQSVFVPVNISRPRPVPNVSSVGSRATNSTTAPATFMPRGVENPWEHDWISPENDKLSFALYMRVLDANKQIFVPIYLRGNGIRRYDFHILSKF